MPGFPFPGRPGGEHDEPLLDMIIARRVLPPDAPREMHDLARMLAALAGPAEPGELAAEPAVRAAFSRATSPVGISSAVRRPVRHRRTRPSRRSRGLARSRARLATVLVLAAAGLGSVLAAYAGVLPSPIQQLAHGTLAAPAPVRSGPTGSATSGPGQTTAHGARAAKSQPPPSPQHSAAPIQPSSSKASLPATRSTPSYSPSTVRPRTQSQCGSGAGHPNGRSPNGPGHGGPGSSRSQQGYCASGPAQQPTPQPTAQPTQYGYPYAP
jgi:hypothetical protein